MHTEERPLIDRVRCFTFGAITHGLNVNTELLNSDSLKSQVENGKIFPHLDLNDSGRLYNHWPTVDHFYLPGAITSDPGTVFVNLTADLAELAALAKLSKDSVMRYWLRKTSNPWQDFTELVGSQYGLGDTRRAFFDWLYPSYGLPVPSIDIRQDLHKRFAQVFSTFASTLNRQDLVRSASLVVATATLEAAERLNSKDFIGRRLYGELYLVQQGGLTFQLSEESVSETVDAPSMYMSVFQNAFTRRLKGMEKALRFNTTVGKNLSR